MEQVLAELSRIEGLRKYDELVPYLAARKVGAAEMHHLALQLGSCGGGVPFLLSQALVDGGSGDWRLPLVMALCALELGQESAAVAARSRLAQHIQRAPAADRAAYARAFADLLRHFIVRAATSHRHSLVLRYLDLWGIVAPEDAALFAPPTKIGPLPVDEIRRTARASDRLLTFPALPSPRPRSRRKCVVAMRKHFYLHAQSREHELSARFTAALQNYGWEAIFYGLRTIDKGPLLAADYREVAELCRAQRPDILVLDEFIVSSERDEFRGQLVAALKRDLANLKIVGIVPDAWLTDKHAPMRAAVRLVDGMMSPFASMPLWKEPEFAGKALLMPVPHGGDHAAAPAAFEPTPTFSGSIAMANWHRAFWVAALRQAGVPVNTRLSSHAADHLPGMVSYRRYLAKLACHSCLLNFSMRSNGARILTGRTFEAPLIGSLLIQEQSDDVDHYFVAGEHYLPFKTIGDLIAVFRFLAERPEEAQAIRERVHAFARENYSDERIIYCLERQLYGEAIA